MDIIGRKSDVVSDPRLLKPLTVEGRPTAYPSVPGHAVIFGYRKTFGDGKTDEALLYCETLADMQKCHDRFAETTATSWYLAEGPGEPGLVEVTMEELDIREDVEGILS